MSREIDRRDDESFQEYADRKERELMEKMWGALADGSWVENVVTKELARMMADSIDAHILNDLTKKLDNESYSEEEEQILEYLRLRDQCPHDAQYTEEMIEEIKEALDKNE